MLNFLSSTQVHRKLREVLRRSDEMFEQSNHVSTSNEPFELKPIQTAVIIAPGAPFDPIDAPQPSAAHSVPSQANYLSALSVQLQSRLANYLPQHKVSSRDFRRFLNEVGSWQSRHETHSALVLCSGRFHCHLRVYALLHDGDGTVDASSHNNRMNIPVLLSGKPHSNFANHVDQLLISKRISSTVAMAPPLITPNDHSLMMLYDKDTIQYGCFMWQSSLLRRDSTALRSVSSFASDLINAKSVAVVDVVVGPVIGSVSSTSCEILLEVAQSGVVEMVVEDSVTGMEHVCNQSLLAGQPTLFYFDALRSNHNYQVQVRNIREHLRSLRKGSFTTLRSATEHSHQQTMSQNIGRIRSLVESSSMGTDGGKISSTDHEELTPFRIIFMGGANVLTASRWVESAGSSLDSKAILKSIQTEADWMRSVSGLFSSPWNGVDVIIHASPSVDMRPVLESAIFFLKDAYRHQCAGNVALERESRQQAMKKLCDAFRDYWGSDHGLRTVLSHGNHVFVCSPVCDFLSCLHSSSLRDCERELSSFVTAELTVLLECVYRRYIGRDQGFSKLLSSDENVGCFELTPLWCRKQGDEVCHPSRDLLQFGALHASQLQALASFLKTHTRCRTLFLLSPFPLVLTDAIVFNHLHPLVAPGGSSYNTSDSIAVLDVLTSWLYETESADTHGGPRRVIILSTTSMASLSSDIYVTKSSSTPLSASEADFTIKQICCGAAVGAWKDSPLPPSGALYSDSLPNVQYRFVHHSEEDSNTSNESHLLVIDIGDSVSIRSLNRGNFEDYRKDNAQNYASTMMTSLRMSENAVLCEIKDQIAVQLARLFLASTDHDESDVDQYGIDIQRVVDLLVDRHITLVSAMRKSVISGRYQGVLSIGSDQHNVDGLSDVLTELISNFSNESRHTIKLPSPFAIAMVRETFLQHIQRKHSLTGLLEAKAVLVTLLTAKEPDTFATLVKMCLFTQLAMEMAAWRKGLLD